MKVSLSEVVERYAVAGREVFVGFESDSYSRVPCWSSPCKRSKELLALLVIASWFLVGFNT